MTTLLDHLTFDDHHAAPGGPQNDACNSESDAEDPDCVFESAVKKITMAQDQHMSDMYERHLQSYVVKPSFSDQLGTLLPPLPVYTQPIEEMKPFPFYHYRDHSKDPDLDPMTPLTPPGRVPNFPAKMHAILCREDLSDIISWMPHGRSWRVLKPREFEVRVIPVYFEHAKFSSFVRQANGWGFRRITQGRDRNSYYHPMFLRALPHLCKKMKRPGVSEKIGLDPDHEPDLYKISDMYPIPEKATDESIMLHCTLHGGPKARMPSVRRVAAPRTVPRGSKIMAPVQMDPKLTPGDQHSLESFHQALGASENQLTKTFSISDFMLPQPPLGELKASSISPPMAFTVPFPLNPTPMSDENKKTVSPLATAHQLSFSIPNVAAAFESSAAASQFAAGFAAATALGQQQFQFMLQSMQQQGLFIPQMEGNKAKSENSRQDSTSKN